MLIRSPEAIAPSEITEASVYAGRRAFVRTLALGAAFGRHSLGLAAESGNAPGKSLGKLLSSPYSTLDEKPTPFKSVTTYGNFYEFGPDKDSPAANAHRLRTRPWTVTVDGEVRAPKTFAIDDLLNWAALEERIYRMRCVEGWSAVIPWVGIPFTELLKRVEITGNAKFVEFWSLADPEQMPFVRLPFLDWPYV